MDAPCSTKGLWERYDTLVAWTPHVYVFYVLHRYVQLHGTTLTVRDIVWIKQHGKVAYAFTYTAVLVGVGYQIPVIFHLFSTARNGPANLLLHDLQLQLIMYTYKAF